MTAKIQNKEEKIKPINYWFCVTAIIILFCCNHGRKINTPFSGLHSWGQATGAWAMRSHVNYGYGFTKGITTWAVGNPPTENPKRYFDHPNLGSFLAGVTGHIFGVKESTLRIVDILNGIVIFLLFFRILRGLISEYTALLAGLLFALFPITGYFAPGGYMIVFALGAIYFYLILIEAFNDNPKPTVWHKIGLAACLFLGLQITWSGFFYAFAIGLHYVCRCIKRKKLPNWSLIAIMVIAPFASMAITFTIMAWGYGWDVTKIVDLYKWRAGNAEVAVASAPFNWGLWFQTLWKHSATNYTVPIVIAAIVYITLGQFLVFAGPRDEQTGRFKHQFPQFWLFIVPAITQLFALRGCLWKHQTWLHPFDPFIATAGALFIMMIYDLLKKIHIKVAIATCLAIFAIFTGYCIAGTNYYYDIRWQPEQKIDMFKMLNEKIPPDKYLLSFEHFTVNQHKSKGKSYRPEIAWYLDREITQARMPQEILDYAKTGKYPYYLMPLSLYDQKTTGYLMNLSNQLQQLYKFEYIFGQPGERDRKGRFIKAGMPNYILFDLQKPVRPPDR